MLQGITDLQHFISGQSKSTKVYILYLDTNFKLIIYVNRNLHMYIFSGFDAHIYVNVYEYEQNGNDYFLLLDIFVLSPLCLIYIFFCFYFCS